MSMTIWEIFIPRENIIVNDAGGCFEENKPRGPIEDKIIDIEVDDKFINSCKKRIKSNNDFSEQLNIFDELKQKYEKELKDNITI